MGWYEDLQAAHEQKWGGSTPSMTPGAMQPPPTSDPGFFENLRRRLHYANQGDFDQTFASDPAAIPAAEDESWFGDIGRYSKMGLNALGALQEVTTTLPFRKLGGIGDKSDIRLSDFLQDNPILNPLGAAQSAWSAVQGKDPNEALRTAVQLSRSGDQEGAKKLIQGRRTEGGFFGGAARAAGEFGMDPTMPLSFGKKVGLAILPALVEAGVKAPVQWIQRASQEGVTQELLSELPQTAVMTVMAAMGAEGQRQAWSPRAAAAEKAAKAKAQADKMAPFQVPEAPGLRQPQTPEEVAKILAAQREPDLAVLTPEVDESLQYTFDNILGQAAETVTSAVDPRIKPAAPGAVLPQRVVFSDTNPWGESWEPGQKAEVDMENGVIFISPEGRAWTLQAPDAAAVTRRATQIIAHEISHPTMRAGRPTGMVDPETGMPLDQNPETGHAFGNRVVDDRIGDLNMLQSEYALREILGQNPRLQQVAATLEQSGRLKDIYGPETMDSASSGTYSPEMMSLAAELGMLGKNEIPYAATEVAMPYKGPDQITEEAAAPHRLTPDDVGPRLGFQTGPAKVARAPRAAAGGRPTPMKALAGVWADPKDPRVQSALEADKARQLLQQMQEKAATLEGALAREQPAGPEARAAAAADPAAMTSPQSIFQRLAGIPRTAMGLMLGRKVEAPKVEAPAPAAATEGRRGQTGMHKNAPLYAGPQGMARIKDLVAKIKRGEAQRNQAGMEAEGIPVGGLKDYWQGLWNLEARYRKAHDGATNYPPELVEYRKNLEFFRGTRAGGSSPRFAGTNQRGAEAGITQAQASEVRSKERVATAQREGATTAPAVRTADRAARLEQLLKERSELRRKAVPKLERVRKIQGQLKQADAANAPIIRGNLKQALDDIDPLDLSGDQRRAYDDAKRQVESGPVEVKAPEAAAPAAGTTAAPKRGPNPFLPKKGPRALAGGRGLDLKKKAKGTNLKGRTTAVERTGVAARFFNRIRGLDPWAKDASVEEAQKQKSATPKAMQPPPAPRTQAGPPGEVREFPFQGRLPEGQEPAPFEAGKLKEELAARAQEVEKSEQYLPKKETKIDVPQKRAAKARWWRQARAWVGRKKEVSKIFQEAKKFDTVHDAITYVKDRLARTVFVTEDGKIKRKKSGNPVTATQKWEKGELSVDDLQDFAGALNELGIQDFKDAPPWAVKLANVGRNYTLLRHGKPEDFDAAMQRQLEDIVWERPGRGPDGKPLEGKEWKGFYRVKNIPGKEGAKSSVRARLVDQLFGEEAPATKAGNVSADAAAHTKLFGADEQVVNGVKVRNAVEGLMVRNGRLTVEELKKAGYSLQTSARLITAFHRLLKRYKGGELAGRFRPGEDGKLWQETPEFYATQALERLSARMVRQGQLATPKIKSKSLLKGLGRSRFQALQDLNSKLTPGLRLRALRELGIQVQYPSVPHPSRVHKTVAYREWPFTKKVAEATGETHYKEPLHGKSRTLEIIQTALGIRWTPEQAERFWETYNQGSVEAGAKRQLFSTLETMQAYIKDLKSKTGKLLDFRRVVAGKYDKLPDSVEAELAKHKKYLEMSSPRTTQAELAAEVINRIEKSDSLLAAKLRKDPHHLSRQKLLDYIPKGLSWEQIVAIGKNINPANLKAVVANATRALEEAGIDIDKGFRVETKMVPVRNRLGTETMTSVVKSVFKTLEATGGYEYPELQGAGGKVGRGTIPDSMNLPGRKRAMPTGGRKGGKAPTFDEEAIGAQLAEQGLRASRPTFEEGRSRTPLAENEKELREQTKVVEEREKGLQDFGGEKLVVEEIGKKAAERYGMTGEVEDAKGKKFKVFDQLDVERPGTGIKGSEADVEKLGTVKTSQVGMGPLQGAKKAKAAPLRGMWEQPEGFYGARVPREGGKAAQAEPGRMAAFDEEMERAAPLPESVDLDASPQAKELLGKVDGFNIGRANIGNYVEKLIGQGKILASDNAWAVNKLTEDIRSREAASGRGLRRSAEDISNLKLSKLPTAVEGRAKWKPPAPKPKKGRVRALAGGRGRPYQSMPGVPREVEQFANLPKSRRPKESAADVKSGKLWRSLGGWMNIARPLLTAFDLSNPFRQTWQLTSEQIVRDVGQLVTGKRDDTSFLKNTWDMIKAYHNKDFYEASKKALEQDSWYKAGAELGLEYASKDHPNEAFVGKEKFDKALSKLKVFGPLQRWVEGAERSFELYQNRAMRDGLKHFMEGMESYKKSKGLGDITPDEIKDAVEHINTAASRAQLSSSRVWNERANYIFYSAQMNVSRLKMLNKIFNPLAPGFTGLSTPASRRAARMQTLRAVAGAAGMAGAVYSIALAQGLEPEFELDPKSTDFGKVRVGNTTFDAWGGNQQFIRVAWQAWTGKQKERSTGLLKDRKLGDTLMTFIRSKFGPGMSTVWNIMDERNLAGETTDISWDSKDPVTGATNLLKELVMPMSVGDTIDLWKENPRFAWTIPLMLMGEGMGAGGGPRERWLEDRSTGDIIAGRSSARREADRENARELRKFGVTPPRLSGKVTLPGRDEYGRRNYYNLSLAEKQEFEAEYMPVVTDLLNEFINSSTYNSLPEEKKKVKLFKYVHKLNQKYGAARRAKKFLKEKYLAGEIKPSNRGQEEED